MAGVDDWNVVEGLTVVVSILVDIKLTVGLSVDCFHVVLLVIIVCILDVDKLDLPAVVFSSLLVADILVSFLVVGSSDV